MGSEVSSGGHNNGTTMELELSTMEQFEMERSSQSDPDFGGKLEEPGTGSGYPSSNSSSMNMKPSRGALFSEDFFCPLEMNPGQRDPVDWKTKTGVKIELETSTSDPAGLKLSEKEQDQDVEGKVGEGACSEPTPEFMEEAEGQDQVPDGCIMPVLSCGEEGGKGDVDLMEGAIPNVKMTDDADDEEMRVEESSNSTSTISTAEPLPTPTDPMETFAGAVAEMGTNTSQPIFLNANFGTSQVLMIESETGMSQPFTVDNGVQTSQGLLDDLLSAIAKKSIHDGKMKMNSTPNAGVATATATSNVLSRTIRQSTYTKPNQASPAKRPRLSNLDSDGNRSKHSIYSTDVTFEFDEVSKVRLGDVGYERSYEQYAANFENLYVTEDLENQENECLESAYSSSSTMSSGSAVCGSSRRVGLSKKSRKPLHSVFLRPHSNENQ